LIADTYISTIGLAIALVWSIGELVQGSRIPRAAIAGACAGVAILLGIMTARQVALWRDTRTLFTHTLEVTRDNALAHQILGNALLLSGDVDAAIAELEAALKLVPDFPEAHNNLGMAYDDRRQFDQAAACYRRALELKPGYAEAHNNLGVALKAQGKVDEAIICFRRAVELNPDYAQAHYNLGNALRAQEKLDDASACYRRALELMPNRAEAHNNLGNALFGLLKLDEAEKHFNEAIRLQPEYDDAHLLRAMLYLLRGDFERGWKEYEWRWQTEKFAAGRRNFTQPRWDGRPLSGRTILLHAEQGLGDTLHFIRYVRLIAAQCGGSVVVECQPLLKRLLQASLGQVPVIGKGEPLPSFDVHCPLLSLPLACGTTMQNIPQHVPYLHADTNSSAHWRNRLGDEAGLLKVGVVWAGNKSNKNDHNRSISLQTLAPLGGVPRVRFYSLQKGEQAQQASEPPAGIPLIDWTNELHDFADTAALVANLDLVISVDTAVAHLAGALGRPVWTLLPFAPDWRWLLDREDSPWYPTMRLFRQPAPGDWPGVITSVADALEADSD